MDRPPPDPAKLLEAWMEWERGHASTPGQVLANLKKAGMREWLEAQAQAHVEVEGSPGSPAS